MNTNRMADVFVDIADTLVDDFDIIDFLHSLVSHASEMTGSAAVGLLLSDLTGGLRHVAATSEDAEILELLQLQHAVGPCVDCFVSGRPVREGDLADALDRWPIFAARALTVGITQVHAFPMRLRDETIGALNVFGRAGEAIEPADLRLVQSLADFATIAILQERALARAETLTEQLQFALNSRIVIEQAKGAVARALGIGVEGAFEVLRSHARGKGLRLTDVARRAVTEPSFIDGLVPPAR